jgi:inward rectifier potassium channel
MAKHKKTFEDLGLGEKASSRKIRTLNKDGTFNVLKKNIPFWERVSFFHALVTMTRLKFVGVVIFLYFFVNMLFASIYYSIGVEQLTGIERGGAFHDFLEAFFFSAQTVTTLGYGRVAPLGLLANSVAAVESMLGLLSFAIATGLVYGRFSKPSAKIQYSHHAVIAPYQGINGFMLRLINPNDNQLLEVTATITFSLFRINSNLREFHTLDLERSSVMFLPNVWTIVHPINEMSPMLDMNIQDLENHDAEFIVSLKAFDESFSQVVYSRTSYKPTEIRWGHQFAYILDHTDSGIGVDASRLDESQPAELN